MNSIEQKVISSFQILARERVPLYKLILFGSRARGDADEDSDMDIMVVIDSDINDDIREYISDCAWEAGFASGIVVMPVILSRFDYEKGLASKSLVVMAAKTEGIYA